MQLLSTEQVKTNDANKIREQRDRIARSNEEETNIVKRLNTIKAEFELEEASIARKRSKMDENHAAHVQSLEDEVKALEERKRIALLPVAELIEQANQAVKDNDARKLILDALEIRLKHESEVITERKEEVLDREQIVGERENDLDKREARVQASENATKESADKLNVRWLDYHKAVHTSNEEMQRREKEVQDAWGAIAAVREGQDKRHDEQNERERQLRDRSRSLERAADELLSKGANITL